MNVCRTVPWPCLRADEGGGFNHTNRGGSNMKLVGMGKN